MQDMLGAQRNPRGALLLTLWESRERGEATQKWPAKGGQISPGLGVAGWNRGKGRSATFQTTLCVLLLLAATSQSSKVGHMVWYLVKQVQEVWNLGFPVVRHQGVYSSPTWVAAGSQTRLRRGISWICGVFFFFPPRSPHFILCFSFIPQRLPP